MKINKNIFYASMIGVILTACLSANAYGNTEKNHSDSRHHYWEKYFNTPFEEMDRFFSHFNNGFLNDTFYKPHRDMPNLFIPKIDLTEDEDNLRMTVELPGMDEKDVEISVSEGYLVLEGEKKPNHVKAKANSHRIERSYGKFNRRVYLPAEVNRDKVVAKFKNGLLTIEMPKTDEAKEHLKKIPITPENA